MDLAALCAGLFQTSVPHLVEGTCHHDNLKVVVKGVLPTSEKHHQHISNGPARSEPKLLVLEKVVVRLRRTTSATTLSNTFPSTERDGAIVWRDRYGAPLVDENHPNLFPN